MSDSNVFNRRMREIAAMHAEIGEEFECGANADKANEQAAEHGTWQELSAFLRSRLMKTDPQQMYAKETVDFVEFIFSWITQDVCSSYLVEDLSATPTSYFMQVAGQSGKKKECSRAAVNFAGDVLYEMCVRPVSLEEACKWLIRDLEFETRYFTWIEKDMESWLMGTEALREEYGLTFMLRCSSQLGA